tara:strand:- start:112 stop:324 length:213 start_codon:yes stop_codon:yes gene_type:complete
MTDYTKKKRAKKIYYKYGCKYCVLESNEMETCSSNNSFHKKKCPRFLVLKKDVTERAQKKRRGTNGAAFV